MTRPSPNRRVLIVGEGRETEYNYFVGFRNSFASELAVTETSISVRRGKGGDARSIVKNAIKESKNFEPDRKRGDRVFLLLDTEGPGNSPGGGRAKELPAAEKLAAKKGIEIVYSRPAFEYWLLCHFPAIPRRQFTDCGAVIVELDKPKRWESVSKAKYHKADQDIFDRLSKLVDSARAQALDIDLHHLRTTGADRRTNPSTQVYELIANLIGVQSGEKCPITGDWKLISNPRTSTRLTKGDVIPHDNENAVHWRL